MAIKILAVGGGSGGHVTPVVAVLREIKRQHKHAELRVWCDRTFAPQARKIVGDFDPSLRVDTIVAGKLRRYHHLSLLQHIMIPSVFWPNLRDITLVGLGVLQSLVKLVLWRPDVVFTKGGYVCLPVGWAAWLLRIPVVIHDSDAHPGLTNRLLARFATAIATGAPLRYYSYPAHKSTYVGVPVGDQFVPFSEQKRYETKQRLGFDPERPLIVVTGGGLGARRINDAVALHLPALLKLTNVILISGAGQYDELRALLPANDPRFQLFGFVSKEIADMLGAADVVVARAGATTILELAALAKPTILVPNGRLTGGHQLKNAQVYADQQAVILVDDERLENPDDSSLVDAVRQVVTDETQRTAMAHAMRSFARPHAAKEMAAIILASTGRPS